MSVEVFAGYETVISVAELVDSENNYSISDNSTISVNNSGNKKVYPELEITANGSFEITEINNDNQIITFNNITLADTEVLTLDFKEQIYEIDGTNIIDDVDFTENKRIFLKENTGNDIEIKAAGDANLNIKYKSYNSNDELYFVESFSIEKKNNYEQNMPFNEEHSESFDLINKEYSVSIDKHSSYWVDDEKEYRIYYKEDNWDIDDVNEKYLLGVVFTDYRRGFNGATEVLNDRLTGEAINLIDKK
ncbi:MAG: hypothetical protein ACQEQF_01750 [Bacillota bacterium]